MIRHVLLLFYVGILATAPETGALFSSICSDGESSSMFLYLGLTSLPGGVIKVEGVAVRTKLKKENVS